MFNPAVKKSKYNDLSGYDEYVWCCPFNRKLVFKCCIGLVYHAVWMNHKVLLINKLN